MESPTTEMLMDDLNPCPEQRKPIAMRAAYCFADNCYQALFPCASPWVVTEAVRYCATVSAGSATNYPTQVIAACGTGKERYISACSCPATNCPIESAFQATTRQDTTQDTAQNIAQNTAQPAIMSIIEDKNPPHGVPTPTVIPPQVSLTATGSGVTSTHTLNDGAGKLDAKPSAGSACEAIMTGLSTTESTSLDHKTSSKRNQTANEEKSTVKSQPPSSSSQFSLSQPLPTPLGQLSTPLSSISPVYLSEGTPTTRLTVPSRIPPTTTTLPPESLAGPTTPVNGSEGLSVEAIAAIAVIATLAALLLLGTATYFCLKRRTERKALSLSQETMLS
ncbi:hypothetical protein F4782DRAFT_324510 [Xylaria castorea]|nr:hypothetical protein F4782DRAFT_324510 [Xylaria castorea]